MNIPYIVEIVNVDNAVGVVIPEELADQMNLEVGDDVILEVNARGDAIILRKKKEFLVTNFFNPIISWS